MSYILHNDDRTMQYNKNMRTPNTLCTSTAALLTAGTLGACSAEKRHNDNSPYCSTQRVVTGMYDKDPHATASRKTWNRGARLILDPPATLTPAATVAIGFETNTPASTSPRGEWHDSRPIALAPYEPGRKVAFAMKVGDRAVAFSLQITDHSAGQPDLCGSFPVVRVEPPAPDTLPWGQAEAGAVKPVWP